MSRVFLVMLRGSTAEQWWLSSVHLFYIVDTVKFSLIVFVLMF